MDTANPALSSCGEFTFEPEDSSSSDLLRALLDFSSNAEVCSADTFVFITSPITVDSFHESPLAGSVLFHGIPAAGGPFRGVHPVIPFWPFMVASTSFRSLVSATMANT
jgi:hypothetical protein